jgi:hypothetical protein
MHHDLRRGALHALISATAFSAISAISSLASRMAG